MQRCAGLLCAFANSRDGGIIIAGVDQGFRVRTGFWGDVARGLVRAAADRLSCPVEAALPARGRLGLAVQGRVRAALPGERRGRGPHAVSCRRGARARSHAGDLDEDLVAGFLSRVREQGGLTEAGDEDVLVHEKVLVPDPATGILRPSLAGLLALGSCPQQFFPSLNVVVDYWRTGDQDVFEGPIPAMIAGVTMLLAKKARVGAARRRYLVPALRECFVNILQHRSYEEADREMPVLISPVAREFQIEYEGSTLRLDHGGRAQAKDLCRRP